MSKAALVQFDIHWENPAANISTVQHLLRDFRAGDFDLLILPELWTCGFTMNLKAHLTYKPGIAYMEQLSREYECAVIGGLPARIPAGQQNRLYLVQGGDIQHYSKIKTFNYAGENLKYIAGKERQLWDVAGFKLFPQICYDLRFPELARASVPEANLIVYIASWPQTRIHHWRQLLLARAIENQAYVIGVNRIGKDLNELNYNGQSMIIDPTGSVVLDAGAEAGVFVADIHAELPTQIRKTFPFLADK